MKTLLITGINGFLGSNLAKAFIGEYNIVGLEYSLENLFRLKDYNFKIYSTDQGIPEKLFSDQKVDIIIHTATIYGRKNEGLEVIANSNLFLPFELLDKAIDYQCSAFINTDTVLDRFVNEYSLTKRQFQEWLYFRRNDIKVINMKLEHFYGPEASVSNFISSMITRLKLNEPSIDLTLGEQQRDFVFIDDVVSAYRTVLKQINHLKDPYTDFQVSTQNPVTIRYLIETLKELTGSVSHLNFGAIPYRENELMHSDTDNSALIQLGWRPLYTIEEGLKVTSNNL